MTVWAYTTDSPEAAIAELERLLDAAHGALGAQRDELADSYLAWIYALGSTGADASDFIAGSAPRLIDLDLGFMTFVDELRDRLLGEFWCPDQWAAAAERRSALQFLLELYGDLLPEQVARHIDLGEVDELLELRGSTEGLHAHERLPPGIPESHWWWRGIRERSA
jgi:hypothetical protein